MSRLSKTVRQMFVICGLLFIGGISSVRAAAAPKANIAGAKRAVMLAFQNYELPGRCVEISFVQQALTTKRMSNMMTEIRDTDIVSLLQWAGIYEGCQLT